MSENVQFGSSDGSDFIFWSNSWYARARAHAKKCANSESISAINRNLCVGKTVNVSESVPVKTARFSSFDWRESSQQSV